VTCAAATKIILLPSFTVTGSSTTFVAKIDSTL
jgi:hypothetical protein